jgi:hypothetical protein
LRSAVCSGVSRLRPCMMRHARRGGNVADVSTAVSQSGPTRCTPPLAPLLLRASVAPPRMYRSAVDVNNIRA